MHYVAKLDEAGAPTPPNCSAHSRGFTRASYVDAAMGSVHMGAGVCCLAPGGVIQPHRHSFEESFYIGAVVWGMGTSNVDSVFVAGKAKKRNGQSVGVDLDEVRKMAYDSRDYVVKTSGFKLPAI